MLILIEGSERVNLLVILWGSDSESVRPLGHAPSARQTRQVCSCPPSPLSVTNTPPDHLSQISFSSRHPTGRTEDAWPGWASISIMLPR